MLANPVADRLLSPIGLLDNGQAGTTLTTADTHTPVSPNSLPVLGACRGEPFDGLELYVTGPAHLAGIYLTLSGRPVRDATGQATGAVITARDDTVRKRAEQQAAAARAELERSNGELEEFAYVASHDLSAPLSRPSPGLHNSCATVIADSLAKTPSNTSTSSSTEPLGCVR